MTNDLLPTDHHSPLSFALHSHKTAASYVVSKILISTYICSTFPKGLPVYSMWRGRVIFYVALVALMALADATPITKESILEDRERRARQLEHVIERTQKSISDSASGTKPLPDEKIESLKHRLEMYHKRMDDFRRALTDEEINQLIEQEQIKSEL